MVGWRGKGAQSVKVKITKSTFNGIEFLPEPRVLNLGGVGMMGAQTLEFELPTEWKSLTVTLHIEREGGDRPEPIVLDKYGSVKVDKRVTAARQGAWMLLATNGTTYTAMTKPAPYRCYKTIDTIPAGADVSPTLYEQLIAQAAACRKEAAEYAAQAKNHRDAAEQAVTNAEAAATRAENASLSLQGDASNLMIYPYKHLCGPASLTADGVNLKRSDTKVIFSGSGSTAAVWPIRLADFPKKVMRITGKCTALTGGVKIVLNADSKKYAGETNYYDLQVLSAGKPFDVTVDFAWWEAHADEQDIDMSGPLDVRFLCTKSDNSVTLENPLLSARVLDSEWIGVSGMTLGAVIEQIETTIRQYHP